MTVICIYFGLSSTHEMGSWPVKQKSNITFNPDFLVYNISCCVKCVNLSAKNNTRYVESDFVKLAKQMKETLNKLAINGVTMFHTEGKNVHTYVMDLLSPKLYRIMNTSKIKRMKDLDQISLLPSMIIHLLCLKGVVSETATKIETASIYSYSNLKRPASNLPVQSERSPLLLKQKK